MFTRFLSITLVAVLLQLCSSARADVTIVTVETSLGSFDIEMLPEDAPATVANFLGYVNRADFDNTFFHRSVPGFVIQGGGYAYDPVTGTAPHIDTTAPVINEFRLSNTRGTVAMAKLGNDPDSATSEWFVNLADNSLNLDNQNGGFTVFGRVLGNGMDVVDAIAALPRNNFGGSFSDTPTINFQGSITADIFVRIIRATAVTSIDTDGDGIPDNEDGDDDNDGVSDELDVFPLDPSESVDTDNDALGNNADTDDDNDGVPDTEDAYPLDPTRSVQEAARLQNISTRGLVRTDDEVMIGGVIIVGSETKQVVIRARGPSLAQFGVPHPLSDPWIELFDGQGNLIDSNDNWQTHTNMAQVPLNLQPSEASEAAIATNLTPGNYTAIVRGVSDEEGIGIVEIFEITETGATRLSNISTRGYIGIDDDVLIGGVIISGDVAKTVTFRARGPSLAALGVPNTIANPSLQLLDQQGNLIDSNDNWQDHASAVDMREDLVPSDPNESAITKSLEPGAYTVIVRGVDQTTGIGIVEAFEID